jgi:hypothetical protein
MVQAPRPEKARPWHQYRGEPNWQLLEPGWGGTLDDDEFQFIQCRLQADPSLAFAWGFRPGQKTRSEAAVRRISMWGNPDCRGNNVRLARARKAETPANRASLAA